MNTTKTTTMSDSVRVPSRDETLEQIRADRYSDAMDSAIGAFVNTGWSMRRDGNPPVGEEFLRAQIASAIVGYLIEYPESGLVRLARPPAPYRDGTTVGPQAAAQPIAAAPAHAADVRDRKMTAADAKVIDDALDASHKSIGTVDAADVREAGLEESHPENIACPLCSSEVSWHCEKCGTRGVTEAELLSALASRPAMDEGRLRETLRRLFEAVMALSQIENGLTLFEGSPTKSQRCFEAWTELDAAGKEAKAVLGPSTKLLFTGEWLLNKIISIPDEASFEAGIGHPEAPRSEARLREILASCNNGQQIIERNDGTVFVLKSVALAAMRAATGG